MRDVDIEDKFEVHAGSVLGTTNGALSLGPWPTTSQPLQTAATRMERVLPSDATTGLR